MFAELHPQHHKAENKRLTLDGRTNNKTERLGVIMWLALAIEMCTEVYSMSGFFFVSFSSFVPLPSEMDTPRLFLSQEKSHIT